MLFLLSENFFSKNHKFWSKIHFLWKKDEFEIVRMDPVGRNYAHSKQNFFLY